MDEQRLRAYLALIQELLRCPSGEESKILKENADLVDADFIKVVDQVAIQAADQGAQGTADFLRDLSEQLSEALDKAGEIIHIDGEDRYSAYIQLIDKLLNCNSGEETEVLRKNQSLIDRGFILKISQIAGMLEQIGEVKAATFLQSLAAPLAEGLQSALPPGVSSKYLDFLAEILRLTSSSNGSKTVVYPFLQSNLDKINLQLADAIKEWMQTMLLKVQPSIAYSIAVDIVHFSILIQKFPSGDRADNLEIAIAGYDTALTVLTQDKHPQEWGGTKNNLGNAYVERIEGEREENLSSAIECFINALEVYERDDDPYDWAMTQNNLGTAYINKVEGGKAANIEKAIECYLDAAQIYERYLHPYQWAALQFNLGNAYSDRSVADNNINTIEESAEDIEQAIDYYLNALEIYNRDRTPQEWAMVQYNLGNAYKSRIQGDAYENLQSANQCYLAALEIYKRHQSHN
ncbi:MAG: hypothetical protein ACFB02_09075 [Mastigocoleus sp.]